MTNLPLVSIVIPCYRDSITISSAIDSLYRQTYQNIEIIVVNDASPETDEVERVLERYPSIIYVKNQVNLGLAASRNIGLRKSRGEFVAFLDADDEYNPHKIEFQIRCSGENIAVACNLENFYEQDPGPVNRVELNSEDLEIVDSLWKISIFNYLTGASILARRDLLLSVGGYDESLRSCEDYDLWLRLLKKGVKVIRIKLPLYLYRFNPEGLSKNINAISYWELEVVKRNISTKGRSRVEYFFTLIIWVTWFLRHLIRAEVTKNSQLMDLTLNNAKKFQASLFVYFIVLSITSLRIPWLLVTVDNLINGAYSKRSNGDDSYSPKKRNFDSDDCKNSPFLSNKIIWVGFFIYSLTVALLFQMLLPILLPSLHSGNGLLSQDSVYFHQSAITLAEEISRNGWGAWKVWPTTYTTGNVAILGAIYAIFGYKPVLLLPLNAALHACSGLCLVLIGRQLFSRNFARVGSLVAGCLYVVFPSSLNWYAQNHKDEYAALGFLLLLLAGILLLNIKTWKESFIPCLLALGGLGLTIFVRPNNLLLFSLLGAGIVFIGAIGSIRNKAKFAPLLICAALIFLSPVYVHVSPHQESSTPQNIASNFAQAWEWRSTPELPSVVDNTFKKLANIRVFMAANALRDGAGSMIDVDHMPSDFFAVMRYLPVAGLNGLFAPYPNSWATKKSPFWIVGVFEIAVCYLLFPGMLWLVWRNRKNLALWWVILSAYAILTAEAFLASNLGTLHRIRYPFIFIFILLGCIGWSHFLTLCAPKIILKDKSTLLELALSPPPRVNFLNIESINNAIPLILVTALLFFSLFARDILFAHIFGLGAVLDDYQYAANLPLAAAALLAVPLCPALIAQFERLRTSNQALARQWVKGMAGTLLLSFSLIGLFLLLVQKSGFIDNDLKHSTFLGIWFFPVVLLSGIIVLGNAVLICNNQAKRATFFQLAVPILAIFIVYFFGEPRLGVIAPIAGLVFGQIINLALVAYFCNKCGFPLTPRFSSIDLGKWGPTYISLVASAAISGLSVPVALYFSESLTIGSTSTFYMGAKIFQSASVFIGAIFLSLVLPYFTRLVNHGDREYSHKIFSGALMLGVYIAALASLMVCLIAPELTKFLFLGRKIGANQLGDLIMVIQIGILQLPFFVASLTIIKYLVALKETNIIFLATLVGQFVNIYLSWLISRHGLSVEMLSIGVALGLTSSTLVLIVWVKAKAIFGWRDLCSLFLMLLVFVAMVLSALLLNYLALIFSGSIFICLPLIFRALNISGKAV